MANYSTYLIRLVKNEGFDTSFINDLCEEIAKETAELERPLIYHVEDGDCAINIRFTCRRSWFDYDVVAKNRKLSIAKIVCDEGGAIDGFIFHQGSTNGKISNYSGGEAAYEFDEIRIYKETKGFGFLSELQEVLKETNSTIDENLLRIKTEGYYECSSYHILNGNNESQRIRKVNREQFLKPYKSYPLERFYMSSECIRNVYLECFTNAKHPEFLISEIKKIQFSFKKRVVHEIGRPNDYPSHLTSNYWDNIMMKEDLRSKYLIKTM